MNTEHAERLDAVFARLVRRPALHQAICRIESLDGHFIWQGSKGDVTFDSPFLIASITKLFTSACLFHCADQQRLSLDDPLLRYVEPELITGLCVHRGHDDSLRLTLADLLAQNSGIEDVYEKGGFKRRMLEGDFSYTLRDLCDETRRYAAPLPARHPHKAYYSDINFELLGAVLEKLTGEPLAQIYRRIIVDPLGLRDTRLATGQGPVPIVYAGDKALHIPHFLASGKASGGIISTARELMVFIRAFFGSRLFSLTNLGAEERARSLQFSMFPLRYNLGFMEFSLPRWLSPLAPLPRTMGHSGSTGSFAFYSPHKGYFIVGNLNQMQLPQLPFQLMARLLSPLPTRTAM